MFANQFDQLPYGTDPKVCRLIGSYFRQIAAALDAQADLREADDREKERRQDRVAKAKGMALKVAAAVENGHDEERALDLLSRRHDIDPKMLRGWYAQFKKKAGSRARLRNVKIMRLAAAGWTDTEIGRKYKLSRGQVNRIVRRMLKANPAPAFSELDPKPARLDPARLDPVRLQPEPLKKTA